MSVVERKLTDEEEAEVDAIRDALRLLQYDDAETDAMRSRAFEALGFLTGTIKGLNRRVELLTDDLAFEKKLGGERL
jgi:hypothetical protein